jgi:DNA-binding NarL/FixJ family response regulator
MTALNTPLPMSVMLVGSDTLVVDAVGRLLSLDPGFTFAGTATSLHEAPLEAQNPDLVLIAQAADAEAYAQLSEAIRERSPGTGVALLDALKNLTVADFLTTVRTFNRTEPRKPHRRHLRPLPTAGSRDMRQLLSDRELEVVRLVAEGLSNKEISARLALSDKTVKNHISHILAKLNLTARTQVAVHALRAGIA